MNPEKRAQWQAVIDDYEKSGLSQPAFCEKHQLSSSNFYYYRKILRGEASQPSSGRLMPVKVSSSASPGGAEIRFVLPNGTQCVFPSNLELCRIKELIKMVASC